MSRIQLLTSLLSFFLTSSLCEILEEYDSKKNMNQNEDQFLSRFNWDDEINNADGGRFQTQMQNNFLTESGSMDFTIDTFANKIQKYDGSINLNVNITFTYISTESEKSTLLANDEPQMIPKWLNLFFFPGNDEGQLQLQYVKYKRGLLTTEETATLKAALCPASDRKKANKPYFFLELPETSIKEFKNQGFLNILDSSKLCLPEEDKEIEEGVMVHFDLKVALLDKDETYIEIVKCKSQFISNSCRLCHFSSGILGSYICKHHFV